jgi:hypothetical protein
MTMPLDVPTTASVHSSAGVAITVAPAPQTRARLTCAFRPILAIPHLILVGGPIAFGITVGWRAVDGPSADWAAGTGVLGAVAAIVAMIAWFAILLTGKYPEGLWNLAAFYLRWRVRVLAYVALLRDEYPPFGDGPYPVQVEIFKPTGPRNRLMIAFRIFLLVPHFILLWFLSVLWFVTSVVAWFAILFTGRFPDSLYDYGVAVLRWSVRVEAYLLLLHDEYPPFSLEQP